MCENISILYIYKYIFHSGNYFIFLSILIYFQVKPKSNRGYFGVTNF